MTSKGEVEILRGLGSIGVLGLGYLYLAYPDTSITSTGDTENSFDMWDKVYFTTWGTHELGITWRP